MRLAACTRLPHRESNYCHGGLGWYWGGFPFIVHITWTVTVRAQALCPLTVCIPWAVLWLDAILPVWRMLHSSHRDCHYTVRPQWTYERLYLSPSAPETQRNGNPAYPPRSHDVRESCLREIKKGENSMTRLTNWWGRALTLILSLRWYAAVLA